MPRRDENIDLLEEDLFPSADLDKEQAEIDLKKVIGDYFDDSIGTGVNDEIMEQREEALKIYNRKPYGNEQPGRSSFVTSDAMDTVNWLLPSLLNVFMSQPKTVEFVPSNVDAIPEAEQMTDYISYLVMEENDAFSTFYTWFWDALVTKNGFVKWYYKEKIDENEEKYTGLTEQQVGILADNPEIEIVAVEQNGFVETVIPVTPPLPLGPQPQNIMSPDVNAGPVPDLSTPPMPAQPQIVQKPLYDVVVIRRTVDKQIKMENVAPSNVMVHNKATCIEDAKFIGITYYKTKSDLLDDGFTEDVIDGLPTTTNTENNTEAEVRNDVNLISDAINTTKYYEIIECFAYIPDENGVEHLRRIVLCDRNAKHILLDERADEIPLATITPFIKPYSFFGTSIVDMVKDVQKVNTTIWRTMLDYMYTSAFPQWEILDRAIVNKDDVQRRVPGGLIRTRQLGSIQPVQLPAFPAEAVGLLDKLRDVKDARTGVTAFNMGLDPNALKANTTTAGIEMAAAGRQIQDMIARTFAETGIKRLYKGLYGLVVRHANEKKVVRLRGSFVEIDPTSWKLPVRVSVNVGLGTGTAKAKVNDLQQLLALQLQFLPYQVANPKNMYNTLAKIVTTLGYKDIDTFLTDPTMVPPPPEKPTPEEVAIKQIEADLQREQMKASMDKYETDVKADVELTKLNVETALKQQALALKYVEGKEPDSKTDYFPGVRD